MTKKLYYPPVGIAHMVNDVLDVVDFDYSFEKVIINTSSQPNSQPHIGTIITLMLSFALSKKIKEEKLIASEVQFDQLENSPIEKLYFNDVYLQNL